MRDDPLAPADESSENFEIGAKAFGLVRSSSQDFESSQDFAQICSDQDDTQSSHGDAARETTVGPQDSLSRLR